MQVQIRDSAAFRRISPAMLRAYLETKEWIRQEIWRDSIAVWAWEHNGEVQEILVPLQEWSRRYAVRISEVVETLSEVEQRSQLDVFYDLIGAGADVIRLQSLNGYGESSLSLDDSANLLDYSRNLLAASARAAERPGRPVYLGRFSGIVVEYLRGVHPLPGYETGYDLTLHSRVSAGYGVQVGLGDSFPVPFARRATIALNGGLREAGKIAEAVLGGEDISTFENVVPLGVSANFCDAVAALARQAHGIKVGLSWAAVRPSDVSSEEFVFAESSADVLADGAEWLRRTSPFPDVHVVSEIVRLDRESREEFDGRAVVLHQIDGRPVVLQVQFDVEDREKVLRAFRDGIEVSLDGDIHREGKQYSLRDPRNFAIVT